MESTEVEVIAAEVKVYKCSKCGRESAVELRADDGKTYCRECYDGKFWVCDGCHKEIERGEDSGYYRVGNSYTEVCHECYVANYFTCDACELVRHDDEYADDGECNYCHESHDDGDNEYSPRVTRPFSILSLSKFQSADAGEYISSRRVFSAEIECYYPDADAMRDVAQCVAREIGIEYDGSLNDKGIEFQTPKCKGNKGEKAIKGLCAVLNKANFTLDNKAGLHIHLDGADFIPRRKGASADSLRRLWQFYLDIDEVLLSFLPRSRRANTYCAPVSNVYHKSELATHTSLQDLEKYWYKTKNLSEIKTRKRGKDSSRYVGVNLHSLLANKHLEIRYHSGTINPIKILEWVNLHQRIMDKAAQGSTGYPALAGAPLSEKTAALFDVLQLSDKSRQYWKSRQHKFLVASNGEEN